MPEPEPAGQPEHVEPPQEPEPETQDAAPPPRRGEAREIATEALHALAHPLRVRMYDELCSRGPATASELARRFGESTGATSYHLRQLARHGFIEEDPTRGTLRERYWRATAGNQRFASQATLRSAPPATREAARLVTSEWNRGRAERAEHWLATITTWPVEWADASLDLTGHVRLRAEELAELTQELQDVVARWIDEHRDHEDDEDDEDDDLYDVELQIHAFPLEPPRGYEGGLTSEPAAPRHTAPAGPPAPLPRPSPFPPQPPFPPPPQPPQTPPFPQPPPFPPQPPQPPQPPRPY